MDFYALLSIFPARMNLHFQIIASIQHNHLYIIYAVKGAQHPVTLSFHDMSQDGYSAHCETVFIAKLMCLPLKSNGYSLDLLTRRFRVRIRQE